MRWGGLPALPASEALQRIITAGEHMVCHQVLINPLCRQPRLDRRADKILPRLAQALPARCGPGERNGLLVRYASWFDMPQHGGSLICSSRSLLTDRSPPSPSDATGLRDKIRSGVERQLPFPSASASEGCNARPKARIARSCRTNSFCACSAGVGAVLGVSSVIISILSSR